MPLPKNRYEHIHVRFSPAIHGLRNFWEGASNTPFGQRSYSQTTYCELFFGVITEFDSLGGRLLPKICGAMDGGAEAPHGCAEGAVFGRSRPPRPPPAEQAG